MLAILLLLVSFGTGPAHATKPAASKSRVVRPTPKMVPSKLGRAPLRVKQLRRAKKPSFTPCTTLPSQSHAGAHVEPGMDALVADKFWVWPNGSKLAVHFEDGTPQAREAVAAIAVEWSKHANIELEFFLDPAAPPKQTDILIEFGDLNCNSAMGPSSRFMIESGDSSMKLCNIDKMVGTEWFRRVVLHEFGHALGMHHEHQSPKTKFEWNKEFVYQYYASTAGWDKFMVDTWVFRKIEETEVHATEYDPTSVMQYEFPKEFTKDGIAITGSSALSPMDKQFIASIYPGAKKPVQPKTFLERRIAVKNDTGQPIGVRVVYETKGGKGWKWRPSSEPDGAKPVAVAAGAQVLLPKTARGRKARVIAHAKAGDRAWSDHADGIELVAAAGYQDKVMQTFVVTIDGPPDAPAELDRDGLWEAATAAETAGDHALARARYEEFVKRFASDPWVPWARMSIATTWMSETKWQKALEACYALIIDHPSADASMYAWYYGGVSSINLGRCDDAKVYFDFVVDPGSGLPVEWRDAAKQYLGEIAKNKKAWCG